MPKLIATEGPTRGRRYELAQVNILGRSPSCQIYIGDLTVSRQHARLVKTEQGHVLEDLGSGNGTYVNGRRITQRVLQHNDELRISNSTFRFVAAEPPRKKNQWVNMVTVVAEEETGLISVESKPGHNLPDTMPIPTDESVRADLAKAYRMLETLYAVSNATTSVLEPTKLFTQILDYLFKVFPSADRGYIMQLDEQNQLVPGAIRTRRTEGEPEGLVLSQTLVSQVLREGRAVLSAGKSLPPGQTLTPYERQRSSKMCAPLTAQGQCLGILHIEARPRSQSFTQEDLDLLSGIARQAAVAILNASLHQRLMRQQRLEQDLRFAKQVQQSFLPAGLPEVPGYVFDRRYNPYYDVGGDFYDFIPLPEGRLGLLIGDVSGKGVSAALLMARLTSDMRYYAISEVEPARVLHHANNSLLASVQDNMFATVVYMVLDSARGQLTLSNAGHIPPLLRRGSGEIGELDDATSLALGVLPDTVFEQITVPLAPGDHVLLCTDGVVEAKNPRDEEYGVHRLRRALAAAAPDMLLDAILKNLMHFTGATAQYDDITLVTCSRV